MGMTETTQAAIGAVAIYAGLAILILIWLMTDLILIRARTHRHTDTQSDTLK